MKIIFAVLIFALIFSACGKSTDSTPDLVSMSDTGKNALVHMEKQAKATTAYQSLIEHFQPTELDEGEFEYDSDYGGAYINDNDDLVICVKGLTQESKNKYILYCGTEEILFREVKYSFSELRQYAAMIHSALSNDIFYGVNEQNNCIDVYISPGTEIPENLKDFPITFVETEDDLSF